MGKNKNTPPPPLSVINQTEATRLSARVDELIDYAEQVFRLRGQYGDYYAVTPDGVVSYSLEDDAYEDRQHIAKELVTWDELRYYRATLGTVQAQREADARETARQDLARKRQQYERLKEEFGA